MIGGMGFKRRLFLVYDKNLRRSGNEFMKDQIFPIDEIYIPAKRRKTLDLAKVAELAESILDEGLKIPIQVRQGKGRYVLVEGMHRLEACKSLGEETITGLLVAARQH